MSNSGVKMDIKIYHAQTQQLIAQQNIAQLLQGLPSSIKAKALRYKFDLSRYNFVVGRLLLIHGLEYYDLDQDLEYIEFLENGKPHLPDMYFNISHSEDQVICACSKDGILGIDIEKIKPIDFSHFTATFSDNEWSIIKNAKDPLRTFYWFWTRKESIIKALGKNLDYLHQIELDVSSNQFEVEGKQWFLSNLEIREGYVCTICCEQEIAKVEIEEYLI